MVVWAFVAILFREGVYVSDITQIINRCSIHISVYAAIIQIVAFVTLLKRCRRPGDSYVFTRLPRTVDLLAAISSVPVLIGVSMVWDLLVTSLAEHFAFGIGVERLYDLDRDGLCASRRDVGANRQPSYSGADCGGIV